MARASRTSRPLAARSPSAKSTATAAARKRSRFATHSAPRPARTATLTINGTATNITFAATGSWTTWNTLTVNITLNNNATNTIRFASTGADLGNIDQIIVP